MNRKIFILIELATILLATPVHAQSGAPSIPSPPSSNNYVLDTLNWLSEAQEQEINKIARQLDLEGKAQIYVATLDNCGNDKTQYRREIFNTWKIGAQKSNGGLLLLVCWYGGDTSRRSVEVKTDEKMQRIIPDALTATTAENKFVSAFQENQPGRGLVDMVMVFDNTIRRKKPSGALPSFPFQINVELLVFGLIFIIMVIINHKFGWFGNSDWRADDFDRGDSDRGSRDGGGGSSTRF